MAVYCEIDSWIPNTLAPFLSKGQEPREYNGVKGERLRTVKLRGQLSQGLLLPFTARMGINIGAGPGARFSDYEGVDVSELLNIQKWEAPIPAQLAGDVRGLFPDFIPKTDQERIQNLIAEIEEYRTQGLTFEVTEKLDGSSMTVYVFDDDEGVCSRNLNLCETEQNSLWKVCRRERIIEKIRSTGLNLAFQGEIIGEGIQGNPYNIKGQDFRTFDVYNINEGRYLIPQERRALCDELKIAHVPVYDTEMQIIEGVDEMLKRAEMKSSLNTTQEQEGVVFKSNNTPQVSFKVISNKFLLKGGN
jgi:RNA ligase (TIGR02306 family)